MHRWYMRLLSLIKGSKCFRQLPCINISIMFGYVRVCTCACARHRVCVCGYGVVYDVWICFGYFASLSSFPPSLRNIFSAAMNGQEENLQQTLKHHLLWYLITLNSVQYNWLTFSCCFKQCRITTKSSLCSKPRLVLVSGYIKVFNKR